MAAEPENTPQKQRCLQAARCGASSCGPLVPAASGGVLVSRLFDASGLSLMSGRSVTHTLEDDCTEPVICRDQPESTLVLQLQVRAGLPALHSPPPRSASLVLSGRDGRTSSVT